MKNVVQTCVNGYLKDKYIGPMDFRRILPSIIFKKDLKTKNNGSIQEFLREYSILVNTSEKVC